MNVQGKAPEKERPGGGTAAKLAGKYLSFKLGKEEYGIEILKVQEIVKFMKVTRVPKAPPYVRGVVNLRGKVIPVVDLREKFGFEQCEPGDKSCIVMVNSVFEGQSQKTIGALVDEVSEVCNFSASQIEPPPDFGTCVDTSFLIGVAKAESKIVFLLNIDKAISEGAALKTEQAKQQDYANLEKNPKKEALKI